MSKGLKKKVRKWASYAVERTGGAENESWNAQNTQWDPLAVVPFLWIFPNHLSFCFWDAEKPCIKKRKRKISSLPSCINWDTHASFIWMFVEREKKENRELQKCHFAWIFCAADSTPQLKTPLSHCLCECQGSYSFPLIKQQRSNKLEVKKKHKKVKNQHIKVEVLCLMSLSSSRRRRGSD